MNQYELGTWVFERFTDEDREIVVELVERLMKDYKK